MHTDWMLNSLFIPQHKSVRSIISECFSSKFVVVRFNRKPWLSCLFSFDGVINSVLKKCLSHIWLRICNVKTGLVFCLNFIHATIDMDDWLVANPYLLVPATKTISTSDCRSVKQHTGQPKIHDSFPCSRVSPCLLYTSLLSYDGSL